MYEQHVARNVPDGGVLILCPCSGPVGDDRYFTNTIRWKCVTYSVTGTGKKFQRCRVDTGALISEGIEPSTFSVLTKCDNRYTMKPCKTHGRPWVVAGRPGLNTYSVTYSVTYLMTHITTTWTTLKNLYGRYRQAGVPLTHQNIDSALHSAFPIQHRSRVCTT